MVKLILLIWVLLAAWIAESSGQDLPKPLLFPRDRPRVEPVNSRVTICDYRGVHPQSSQEFQLSKESTQTLDNHEHLVSRRQAETKHAIDITDEEDLKTRLQEAGGKLVIIDFMTTWCRNSKIMNPTVKKIATEMSDVLVYRVDVDAREDIGLQYNITLIPTFVFIKDNRKLGEFSGAEPDKLLSEVQKYK